MYRRLNLVFIPASHATVSLHCSARGRVHCRRSHIRHHEWHWNEEGARKPRCGHQWRWCGRWCRRWRPQEERRAARQRGCADVRGPTPVHQQGGVQEGHQGVRPKYVHDSEAVALWWEQAAPASGSEPLLRAALARCSHHLTPACLLVLPVGVPRRLRSLQSSRSCLVTRTRCDARSCACSTSSRCVVLRTAPACVIGTACGAGPHATRMPALASSLCVVDGV